jgi:hypothetical protein
MMLRLVDARFWTDDHVRVLSPMATLVFAYLMTGPESNMTGIFRSVPETFADDLRIPKPTYLRAQAELVKAGVLVLAPNERLLWLKPLFRYQGTKSPQVLKHVRAYLDALPPNPLVEAFCQAYPEGESVLARQAR